MNVERSEKCDWFFKRIILATVLKIKGKRQGGQLGDEGKELGES